MPTKTQLTSLILVAAIIWGGLLLVQGVGVDWAWLSPVSTVTGILAGLLAAFDRWLWRLPFFHGWLVTLPDITGTWKASFQSTYGKPSEETPSQAGDAYVTVQQTFSHLHLRLMTEESTSTVIAATIARQPDRTYRVTTVYLNEPDIGIRQRSAIHYGSMVLPVPGRFPSRMKGTYWTDRRTAGSLLLTDRRKKIVHDLQEAADLFMEKP